MKRLTDKSGTIRLALILICGLHGSPARGQELETRSAEPSAEIREVSLWLDPQIHVSSRERLRKDFEAGLANASVRIVLSEEEPSAPGALSVRMAQGPAMTVLVEVATGAGKRASRVVDLAAIPNDNHELTLAVIAGELVRALTEMPPQEVVESPLASTSSVSSPIAQPAPSVRADENHRSWSLLAGLAGSAFSGGTTWGGATGAVGLRWPRIAVDAQFNFEKALDAQFAQGTIHGELLSGEVGFSLDFVRGSEWSFGPRAALRAGAATFSGEARETARAQAITGPVLVSRVGGELVFQPGAFQMLLRASLGATLAGLVATIDGEQVVGASGLEGSVALLGGGAF